MHCKRSLPMFGTSAKGRPIRPNAQGSWHSTCQRTLVGRKACRSSVPRCPRAASAAVAADRGRHAPGFKRVPSLRSPAYRRHGSQTESSPDWHSAARRIRLRAEAQRTIAPHRAGAFSPDRDRSRVRPCKDRGGQEPRLDRVIAEAAPPVAGLSSEPCLNLPRQAQCRAAPPVAGLGSRGIADCIPATGRLAVRTTGRAGCGAVRRTAVADVTWTEGPLSTAAQTARSATDLSRAVAVPLTRIAPLTRLGPSIAIGLV